MQTIKAKREAAPPATEITRPCNPEDLGVRKHDEGPGKSEGLAVDDFLARCSWYGNLTEGQREIVKRDCFDRSYSPGAIACHRGDAVDHWLGVIEGIVKVDTASKKGRVVTFAGIPAGSWFGEGSVLKEEPRAYSVTAVRDSRLAFMPRSTFLWLLENSHTFSRYVIDQLNARCGYYIGLVQNLRIHEAPARVAFCLTELFNRQLYPATAMTLGFSQEEIGRLSGLSRQNANRALRTLADAGLILAEYGAVHILDLEGLREFAHSED
ncbi:Crp/Fnr family transcriptional regulator [Burkholderia sp. DN3021]|uniref:Crp/Fnr family transcriptional regulator n=1 Tax=Burkholderia TaxID=32008 RepID=UPI001589F71D|nr:Crp/Fnr family transcriptional regulator [Burkholderia pyrrocinia]